MSRKKDPVQRAFDLYAGLNLLERDALKLMIRGFDRSELSILPAPIPAPRPRNFRRKPAQTANTSTNANPDLKTQ